MAADGIERVGALDDGTVVDEVTLRADGITARVMTYGATLRTLETPDRHGAVADIVLGYRTLAEYVARPQFFGACVGRFANRIRQGRFSLDGTTYQVPPTDGGNALHGGSRGFDKRVWSVVDVSPVAVTLRHVSADGEEGFGGTLDATVTYALEDGALTIAFTARTDRATVVNLTNHSYFNLAGEGSGTALDHVVTIAADEITPVDETLIPTGEFLAVAGTALDFRDGRRIADCVRDGSDAQVARARGYDHNYVLRGGVTETAREVVRVAEPTSGRVMRIETTAPGVQFYSGNFLDATTSGKAGRVYRQGDGIAFETQHFPDSPNHANFPTTRLDPGTTWRSTTIWRFGTDGSA